MTLKEIVAEYLKANKDKKFKAQDIAKWIVNEPTHEEICREKKEKSGFQTDDQLIAQYSNEIGSQGQALQKQIPQIKTTAARPREFYWSDKTDAQEVAEVEASGLSVEGEHGAGKRLREEDLYSMLKNYLWSERRVYSMRIDEKTAANTRGPKGNHWLYPDLVGADDLTHEWKSTTKELAIKSSARRATLWSFEVKLYLNSSNVRESFFQTLSNSSWANFGYLAAADIDERAMTELEMLCALHGIGLIQLDASDPTASDIRIPARERPQVDWPSCNRLLEENKDFSSFVELVTDYYSRGKFKPNDWDLAD